MRVALRVDGRDIEITTEHALSSYGQPVVLVDGEPTPTAVEYHPDACACTALGLLADQAGIWSGHATRDALSDLADEMYAAGMPNGSAIDAVIAEFQRRDRNRER